jgi:hypothetical protein
MGQIKQPQPVMLFVGMLSSFPELFTEARKDLEQRYGVVCLVSEVWDFDFTDYYQGQMGSGLKRIFFAFEQLIDPGSLAEIKIETNKLEDDYAARPLAGRVPRPINLDPGYLTDSKVILATTKDHRHRIYLRDGIFAEVTLHYSAKTKSYEPWAEWTYTDYRTEAYREFFGRVRNVFMKKIV